MASAMATPLCKFSPAVKGEADGSELVGRAIRKFFSETGSWYTGVVTTCEATLTDATTGEVFTEGPYFNVRYEDGDEEDVDLQELQDLLVNDENQGVKTGKKGKRGKQALSQHYSSNANMGKHEDDGSSNPPPPSKRRKSDEKRAAAATAAAASASVGEASHPHEEHRAGQLYKLHLENFMCHENFSMTFGPHVNFISGTNGSGKSAVLQGIQACLGVRASDTGRSNSLNSFIREGAHSALIAVTVYNTGEDAYEPVMYGDFITVERRLGAGGSAFTLKNGTNGRVVARGRAALTAMLDSLDLNAANPVAVLTQDTARTFLAGSASDKKKFDLFMEATLLEQISETQRESECRMDEIKAALQTKKRSLREQKETLGCLRDKVQELRTLAETMKYNEILGKAYVWKKVYEKDPPLSQLREKVEVLGPKKLKDIEEQHMEAEADRSVTRDDLAELKAGIESSTLEVQELQKATKEMQAVHKGAKQKLLEADRKVKSMRGRLAEKEEEVQNVIASADEVEASFISSTQAAMESHTEQVKTVETQITQSKQQMHEFDSTFREQQAILGELDAEDQELKHGISRLDAERKGLESELNQMKRDTGGGVMVEKFFGNRGREGKQLLSKIESRKGEFHKAPVGPIGRYLSIQDEAWAQAVEIAIGGAFNKFLVHDQHDAELLRAMAKQAGITLTVVIRRLDLPPHIPKRLPDGILSVMDIVSCKEPELEAIVGNYLLDSVGYENIALEDTYDEARKCMYVASRVYKKDGFCMQKRGASESSFGAGRNPPRPRLVKNNASALATTERQLQEAREALERLHHDHKEITSRRNAAKSKMSQAKEQAKKLQRKTIGLETNLDTLSSQRPDDSNLEDPKSVVEAEIRELNSKILDLKEQLIRSEQTLETAAFREQEAKERFQEKAVEADRLAKKNDKESGAVVEKMSQLRVETQRAEELKEKKEKVMHKIEEFRLKKEKGEKERAEAANEAMELCDEAEGQAAIEGAQEWAAAKLGDDATEEGIEELLDSENLMHELSKMIAKANAAEKQAGGTLEDLEQDLAKDDRRYKKDSNHFQAVVEAMGAVQRGIQLRRQSLKKLDRNTEANVQSRFKHYMSLKGNVGTIKLNRDEGKLIMSVTMSNAKNEKNAAAVEDLKSLSGGERSFTTVSFILALGEITDNPFRAMDEFDVFMDAVNRRISMQSLIKFAHDQAHVQFLFLTPQDIAAVEDAKKACERQHNLTLEQDFIKVVCMQPARNS